MDSSHPRILIIEDDPGILDITVSKFGIEGYTNIITADNGEDGLRKALADHPNVILLDLILPQMNGVEVMKKLRADAWGKTVPVVLLTNLSPDDATLREVLDNQPSYYLIKSDTSLDETVAKVKEVLASVI